MSDTKITYLADGNVRTLVFPDSSAGKLLDDDDGNLVPLAIWGERYLRKYGGKVVRMIETREGDFTSNRTCLVDVRPATAYAAAGGLA